MAVVYCIAKMLGIVPLFQYKQCYLLTLSEMSPNEQNQTYSGG